MYLSGDTSIFGIIGNPVSYSFSPAMQTIAFQHCKYNAVYIPLLVEPKELPLILQSMKTLNIKGANITAPYKKDIIPYLTQTSKKVKVLEAVNLISFSKGIWRGNNTDGDGFLKGLAEINYNPSKTSVQVIGAGGAAESIIYSLAEAEVGKIHIENRTFSKVHNIIQKYERIFPNVQFFAGICKEKFDLLVNTTSIGLETTSLSAPLELIENATVVVDIIYAKTTALIQKAKELGKIVQDGIPMLLYQGALSFEIWLEQEAPIEVMRNCLQQIVSLEK